MLENSLWLEPFRCHADLHIVYIDAKKCQYSNEKIMYDLQSALVNLLLLLARSKIQAQQPYVKVMTVTKVEPDKVVRMARALTESH